MNNQEITHLKQILGLKTGEVLLQSTLFLLLLVFWYYFISCHYYYYFFFNKCEKETFIECTFSFCFYFLIIMQSLLLLRILQWRFLTLIILLQEYANVLVVHYTTLHRCTTTQRACDTVTSWLWLTRITTAHTSRFPLRFYLNVIITIFFFFFFF
jgi:hypothetical protein